MTTADTNLSRLTQLASAGQLPGAVKEREFYIYLDGANQLKPESFISDMLAKTPALASTLPTVLPTETAGGWKTPQAYNITATVVAPPAPPMAPPAPPAPAAPPAPPVVAKVEVIHEAVRETAPASAMTVTVANQGAMVALPGEVSSNEEADAIFHQLMASTGGAVGSIADAVSEIADAGGMSHKLPIAQLKGGNWDVPKQVDSKLAEHMPIGNRPYTAVYLCYRLGATGWQGGGAKGSGGKPPLWRFALPHPKVNPAAWDYIKEVIRHGRRVQFTPGLNQQTGVDKKAKFDGVGRMTPEVHVLCWRPIVGFFELVIGGYASTTETINSLDAADKNGLTNLTCSFSIETVKEINKKVAAIDPTAKNASWDSEIVKVSADGSEKSAGILTTWREFCNRDRKTLVNTMLAFMNTTDFDGMTLPQIDVLLKKYNEIEDEPRVGR